MIGSIILVILVLVGGLCYQWYHGRRKLPPGPLSIPFFGSMWSLQSKELPEHRRWIRHKDAYGPISSISLMGTTIIVLHDKEAAVQLLEKESLKTSGRPSMEFASNLCGLANILVGQQYTESYRLRRKYVHQQLGTKAMVAQFDEIQNLETQQLLLHILNRPDSLFKHINVMLGAILLQITYGYHVKKDDHDPLVDLVEQMGANMSQATESASWMVDIIPALKYIPEGFPGTGFKRIARKWRKVNEAVAEVPYEFVRQKMSIDDFKPSYVSKMVQQCSQGEIDRLSIQDEDAIKWTGAVMYAGGTDTTASALKAFILAMAQFPEVQLKAQAEVDRVVGFAHLPTFSHLSQLHFLNNMVKEVLRWSPVSPMGFPHVLTEEATYRQYTLPKGSVLLPAVWWFLHDPNVYSKPESFNPDRYEEPNNEPDGSSLSFGFGRRACIGNHLAWSTLLITMARILSFFNIRKAIDEDGKEIEGELSFTPGLLGTPLDFPYRIVPRSKAHSDLIQSFEDATPSEGSDAVIMSSIREKFMSSSE